MVKGFFSESVCSKDLMVGKELHRRPPTFTKESSRPRADNRPLGDVGCGFFSGVSNFPPSVCFALLALGRILMRSFLY